VIEVLLNQHKEIRRLFRAVKQAKGKERRDAFDALRAMLAVHETGEQEILRPMTRLSVPGGGDIADARLQEENQAEEVLARLQRLGPDAPEFDAELRQFEKSVLEHADREEAEEFPGIRQAQGPDRLWTMAKRLKAAEARAPSHLVVVPIQPTSRARNGQRGGKLLPCPSWTWSHDPSANTRPRGEDAGCRPPWPHGPKR
jgi:hemerythrin superfamily protein